MGTLTTHYGFYKPDFDEGGWDDELNATLDSIDSLLFAVTDGGGAAILTGSGVPSGGTGNDGDIYIRSAAPNAVYQKVSGSWGSALFNLQGATGAGTAGAAGASFLSGHGTPSAGTGANGDTYLNLDTGLLYGPKAAGAWGASSGTVMGATGLPGPTAEVKQVISAAGSSRVLDTAVASVFDLTLNLTPCAISFTPNETDVPVATLILRQGSATRLVTWASDVAFPGGTPPTLSVGAADIDIITFFYDGTWWHAGHIILNSEP